MSSAPARTANASTPPNTMFHNAERLLAHDITSDARKPNAQAATTISASVSHIWGATIIGALMRDV